MQSKLIVVLGATGNQGGSVANTFLQDPNWRVRAVTRNASSPKAESLTARGAEVVVADMDSPDSLLHAFGGAHAIYVMSDPLDALFASPGNNMARQLPNQGLVEWATGVETLRLNNAIDAAAKISTLERFIMSSLQDANKLSNGKYKQVHHFESKAKAEVYAKETYPDLWSKTSIYLPGWFLSNILPGGMSRPNKDEAGVLQFSPGIKLETTVPVFAAEEDSGPIVQALIHEPSAGKNQVTGHKAVYVAWPTDPSQLPLPPFLHQPMAEMTYFWDEFGYTGCDTTVLTLKDLTYPPALGTVAEYLQKRNWL